MNSVEADLLAGLAGHPETDRGAIRIDTAAGEWCNRRERDTALGRGRADYEGIAESRSGEDRARDGKHSDGVERRGPFESLRLSEGCGMRRVHSRSSQRANPNARADHRHA